MYQTICVNKSGFVRKSGVHKRGDALHLYKIHILNAKITENFSSIKLNRKLMSWKIEIGCPACGADAKIGIICLRGV